ncbi:MAG: CcdB family protein [Novosphingobium sp.]
MAQFDIFRMPDGGYWVDCQTDWMDNFETKFVIPLVPLEQAPQPSAAQLNPHFEIMGRKHVLLTQFAGTIPARELADFSGSLETDRYIIIKALDFLITGV